MHVIPHGYYQHVNCKSPVSFGSDIIDHRLLHFNSMV